VKAEFEEEKEGKEADCGVVGDGLDEKEGCESEGIESRCWIAAV
jgi:hypothetical protein